MMFRIAMHVRSFVLLALFTTACAAAAQSDLAPIPPLGQSFVIDATNTLTAEQLAELDRQSVLLEQRTGSQLQILIVPTARPEDVAAYAQRVFDHWKLGRPKIDDGLLLLVAKDERRVRIHVGYGLEGAIPDITAHRVIQETLAPPLSRGDFAGGLRDASDVLIRLIEGEALPAPLPARRPLTNDDRGVFFILGMTLIMGLAVFIQVAYRFFQGRALMRQAAKATRKTGKRKARKRKRPPTASAAPTKPVASSWLLELARRLVMIAFAVVGGIIGDRMSMPSWAIAAGVFMMALAGFFLFAPPGTVTLGGGSGGGRSGGSGGGGGGGGGGSSRGSGGGRSGGGGASGGY